MQDATDTAPEPGLTRICCISNVLPVAGADEQLNLRKERLKVGDVWHGELHKSGRKKKSKVRAKSVSEDAWTDVGSTPTSVLMWV